MFSGTNLKHGSDFNRRIVLETVRFYAPVSRAEIAERTGLNPATITNIVRALLDENLLVEQGRRQRQRGQPAVNLDINPQAAYTIGLHIDRDNLAGVAADFKGRILAQINQPIAAPSPDEAIALLSDTYHALAERLGGAIERLLGVGVVTAGPLDPERGVVSQPPNFPGWNDFALAPRLEAAIHQPVYLDNNATAAAIGERWYGIGRSYSDFLYVCVSQGLGGGLILGGNVHRGVGKNAAEFGQMIVEPGGLPSPSGVRGCLESRFSIYALIRDLGPDYARLDHLSAQFAAANPALRYWLDLAARYLAQGIVNIDNLLDLEAVVLGGRLPKPVLNYLRDRVEAELPRLILAGRPHYARIEVSPIEHDSAEALGAATLPTFRQFFPAPASGLIDSARA